jgi:hypothetical protein
MSKRIGKTLLAATIGLVGIAGSSIGISGTAHAGGSASFVIFPYQDAWSGFSVLGLGSRNFTVSISGATANDISSEGVWFGGQDLTTHVWYGGWTATNSAGSTVAIIGAIPASSCGHTFRIDATDWHNHQGLPTDAAEVAGVVDNCGPMLGQPANPVPQPVIGNGFTPGARVILTDRITGVTQRVTASSLVIRHHGTVPMIIPGGDIAATFAPLNCDAVSAAYASKPNVTVAAVRTQCF